MQTLRFWKQTMVGFTVFAASLQAGTYYEARTVGEGKGTEMQESTVKGWVDGDKVKVLFESSRNPYVKKGNYLLTLDGGKTIYLVNPEDKTYSKWDLDAMVQLVATSTKMMKMEYFNIHLEKLEEKPGGVIAGVPTTYYKYRTTYRQTFQFLMMKGDNQVEEIREVWAAPELVEKGLGVYLRKTPPKTTSEDLNRLVAVEYEKMKGVPLKTRTVTTIQNKKGETQTTVVTMEVTKFQVMPVPADTFAFPSGYKEVSLLPTGEGPEGEANPFSKLFQGKEKQ